MRINPIDTTVRAQDRKPRESDADYLQFLRKQPSAFSGNSHNIVAAHYRNARNSGIGCKPLWSAIPLTNEEHLEQHRIGQFKFASRAWWEAQVLKYQIAYEMTGGKIPKKYRMDIHA